MDYNVLSDAALLGVSYAALEAANASWAGQLMTTIDSNQETETLAWLGNVPGMREWIGGKQAKTMLVHQYSISSKDWESTVEYHRRDLAEDKTGQLQSRLNEQMTRALGHRTKLLSQLIANGATAVCYDGHYFFDTNHVDGDSGQMSNNIQFDVTTPDGPTAGEMERAILASIQQLFTFKDDQGEPINENAADFLIIGPAKYMSAALAATTSPTVIDGTASRTNLIQNSGAFKIRYVPNARLTGNKFATFRVDGGVKPFINLEREPLEISVLGEGSDFYFETHRKRVSVTSAGNVGYGLWQHAVQTELT